MLTERWRQIEAVFLSLLERPPEARDAYLKEACESDTGLRNEIAGLLAAYERTGDPLDLPTLYNALDKSRRLPESPPALLPGDRIGRYEILSGLGVGGMGEVYLARDPELARKVAIKVLAPIFAADAERVRRLYGEGRAASALNHPNILTVYDIGDTRGRPYLATEFVEGETLRGRLRDGRIPPQDAVRIAVQAASALQASHSAGILHRDIKPENLMLRPDGLLKVLDFGLAKVFLQPASQRKGGIMTVKTEPGTIRGSICYMSPEQVSGRELDARTDLWSLGVVLYEMLTGQPPFCIFTEEALPVAVIYRILNREPVPVQKLAPEVPAWLVQVVERCLAKDRDQRFESMAQLRSALEQTGAVSVARRGRRRAIVLSLATALLAIAVAVAGRLVPRPLGPPSFEYFTYSGRDFSPAVSPDGRTIAFTSDRDGQPRIWLKQMADGSEVALTTGSDDAPRFSPDGAAVLFVRRDGSNTSLFRIPVVGGAPRRLFDDVVGADFSPDGREIGLIRWQTSPAFTGSVIGIVKSDGSEPLKEVLRVPLRQLQMPRWSPDGKHIASVDSIAGFGTEVVVTTRDGKMRVLDAQTERAISSPAWLSSGEDLVYVRGDFASSSKSDLVRHSLHSEKLTPLLLAWPHRSRCLDILGNGRVIFDTSSRRSNLRELPLHGGAGRWLTRGTSMDRQPAFSPDGKRVAFTSDRSGNTDIWELDLHTNQLAKLIDHPADDMDPAYTPDGKGIIWTSNRVGHLEIYMADHGGGRQRRVTEDGVDAQNATMTADGRWIVYTSSHPTKKGIWKIHPDGSGAERIASGAYFNPEVSPDGKYALYITSVHPTVNAIRVLRIEDGFNERFEIVCEIRKPTQVVIGRARWSANKWSSNNQAILFIGQDENGIHGIFEQPFAPGRDTSGSRRRLAAFDPDTTTESFGISPEGRLIVASWDQLWSLMIADRIPGVEHSR